VLRAESSEEFLWSRALHCFSDVGFASLGPWRTSSLRWSGNTCYPTCVPRWKEPVSYPPGCPPLAPWVASGFFFFRGRDSSKELRQTSFQWLRCLKRLLRFPPYDLAFSPLPPRCRFPESFLFDRGRRPRLGTMPLHQKACVFFLSVENCS